MVSYVHIKYKKVVAVCLSIILTNNVKKVSKHNVHVEARKLMFGSYYRLDPTQLVPLLCRNSACIPRWSTSYNKSQMPRLVKSGRNGKPRILEIQGGKPVIVEYGYIYRTAQANGIQSTWNDASIPIINTNENNVQLNISIVLKFNFDIFGVSMTLSNT
jgi:hypothetical protein